MGADVAAETVSTVAVVHVELAHSSAASAWSAFWRRRVRPLQFVPDSSHTIVTGPAVTFDVRVAGDLVSMIHAVTEDTVALINYHPTLFARPHFLEVSMGPGGLLPHFELRQEEQMPSDAFNCRRMPPVR